jgi:hypothetical protein
MASFSTRQQPSLGLRWCPQWARGRPRPWPPLPGRSRAENAPRLQRRGRRVPLCLLWLLTLFFLNSAHAYSIIGDISGPLSHLDTHLDTVRGGSHGASCCHLRSLVALIFLYSCCSGDADEVAEQHEAQSTSAPGRTGRLAHNTGSLVIEGVHAALRGRGIPHPGIFIPRGAGEDQAPPRSAGTGTTARLLDHVLLSMMCLRCSFVLPSSSHHSRSVVYLRLLRGRIMPMTALHTHPAQELTHLDDLSRGCGNQAPRANGGLFQ